MLKVEKSFNLSKVKLKSQANWKVKNRRNRQKNLEWMNVALTYFVKIRFVMPLEERWPHL